MTIWRMLDT